LHDKILVVVKKVIISLIILIALAATFLVLRKYGFGRSLVSEFGNRYIKEQTIRDLNNIDNSKDSNPLLVTEIFSDNLEIPWEIAFLPNGEILVTERTGRLVKVGKDKEYIDVPGVKPAGEGGLLGATLHPEFSDNYYLYLYITSEKDSVIVNKVERYVFKDNSLSQGETIIDNIPGASYHDGGRIEFGPDGYLYITTGDAGNDKSAQDLNSLAGKILRIKDDGTIPEDNPFDSPIYSYGHRNPQGLAWDSEGRLWATEHGRSGNASGYDELNSIEKGKNYGWPEIQGDEEREGMVKPAIHSGPSTTWAPAGLEYWNGKLYFAGLRGSALYEVTLDGDNVIGYEELMKGNYGRLRAVREGPDHNLYLTTSNKDGRGSVFENDDKLIMLKVVKK